MCALWTSHLLWTVFLICHQTGPSDSYIIISMVTCINRPSPFPYADLLLHSLTWNVISELDICETGMKTTGGRIVEEKKTWDKQSDSILMLTQNIKSPGRDRGVIQLIFSPGAIKMVLQHWIEYCILTTSLSLSPRPQDQRFIHINKASL